MSLESFQSDGKEKETYWDSHKRPIVNEEVHRRVDQYATRRGISNKEAYDQIVRSVVGKNGKIKPKSKGIFAYDN